MIVNEVNFDSSGEDVGICFDDSSVVISSSLTAEKDKFEDHRPVNAFALDPKYACKASKQFVSKRTCWTAPLSQQGLVKFHKEGSIISNLRFPTSTFCLYRNRNYILDCYGTITHKHAVWRHQCSKEKARKHEW